MVRDLARSCSRGHFDPSTYTTRPVLVAGAPAPSWLHCGNKPLAYYVSLRAHTGRFDLSASCYIDCDGGSVFPA
jgi:hypothetical protein